MGAPQHLEYEENGHVYVEGQCRRCESAIRSEIIEKDSE